MENVLKLTIKTSSNLFAGVAATELLRTFATVSQDYVAQIRRLYEIQFEDVTLKQLQELEGSARDLHALAQVLREVGNRRNAFAGLERGDNEVQAILWRPFSDYEDMTAFYLTIALPAFLRRNFYGWLCHDVIEQASKIMKSARFLLTLAQQEQLSARSYDEMKLMATDALWRFEAIVDAAAGYEQQQFGEGSNE